MCSLRKHLLRGRTKSHSSLSHLVAVSDVKPKNYKRHLTTQGCNLEGYDIKVLIIGEHHGRGMILYIHNSLPLQIHQFDVEFNEAQFCTLKLGGKDTLLVGSFHRSPGSTTENNDNLNSLLDKLLSRNFQIYYYLET